MAQGSAGPEYSSFEEEAAVAKLVGAGAITEEHWNKVKRGIVYIENLHKKAKTVTKGSGFIAIDEKKRWLLITCNHVLPSLADAMTDTFIYFGRTSKDHPGTAFKGQEIIPAKPFFKTDGEKFPAPWNGRRFDYTAVEVREDVLRQRLKDELPQPFSLTKCEEMKSKEDLDVANVLYVVHYPKDKGYNRCLNSQHIRKLEGPYIGHIATTFEGSSGSPMLREYNDELVVVGLHSGGRDAVNLATRIQVIVDHMQGKQYGGTVPDFNKFAESATEWIPEKCERVHKSDVSKIPPSADLPSAEDVLIKFRKQFIRDVVAHAVAFDLKINNIIPQACEANISAASSTGVKQRNEILHAQLVRGSTRDSLIKACDIFIAAAGNPNMIDLGKDMQKELEPPAADPAAVLGKYREQFIRHVVAHAVASELRINNIIPDACEADISAASSTGQRERNQILFTQLVQGCNREALILTCDIFMDDDLGSPKMKALGMAMRERLVPAEGK